MLEYLRISRYDWQGDRQSWQCDECRQSAGKANQSVGEPPRTQDRAG